MIRYFRKQNGYTQEQLSKYTGVPRSTISELERGLRPDSPSREIIYKFIERHNAHAERVKKYNEAQNKKSFISRLLGWL